MKLGDKIKKARIEAKMTQKELADGKITRNMLSQIENGKATPSVSTLNHITDKLGLPGGYFFADANDEISFKKSLYISDIKDVYLKKNYSDALTLCQAHYEKEDDELLLIAAESALMLGISKYNDGQLDLSSDYLAQALKYSKECRYSTEWIKSSASKYINLIREIVYLPGDVNDDTDSLSSPEFEQQLVYYKIAKMIDSGDNDSAMILVRNKELTDPIYLLHVKAKLDIKHGNYITALSYLHTIISEHDVSTIDSVLLFKIYSDLELCYKETEDYQNAYVYSEQKNELLEKITLPTGK